MATALSGTAFVFLLFTVNPVSAAPPTGAWLRSKIKLDKEGVPLAAPEEAVDRVAFSYETEAIKKLQSLLIKPKSLEQQAQLLDRMAHLQQQRADIVFRIAHTAAYEARKPIDLGQYRLALRESVETLNKLIDTHTNYRDLPGAYLMRARALRELDDRPAAIRDFLVIESRFPNRPEIRAACLELAELAEESGDFRTAVKYLLLVLKSKEDKEHYAHALYRLAWAHYQLGSIDKSMAYVRVHSNYQTVLMKRAVLRSEPYSMNLGMREDLLTDSALFYLKGFQMKLPEYTTANALPFFRKLVLGKESDPSFKAMVVRYTSLLRAEGFSEDLVGWKNEVIRSLGRREESLKVVTLVMEDQLNKYRFAALMETVKDITELFGRSGRAYSFRPAEKMLLEAATKLQDIISKDKDASSAKDPTLALEGIYKTYLSIAQADDPGLIRVHFNLGEALSSIERFDEAAIHYQWIFDNALQAETKRLAGVNPIDSALKALAIKYDSLKKRHVIPADLQPKALGDLPPAEMDKGFVDWLGLLDNVDRATRGKIRNDKLEYFRLESNRTIYAVGRIEDALKRLDSFVKTFPDSHASVPSAKLVIDTWIASKKWREAEGSARTYSLLTGWKDDKFGKDLPTMAADFAYKAAEADFNENKHDDVIAQSQDFLSKYPKSQRREDVLSLSSRSALALGKDQAAAGYLSAIIETMPSSKYFDKALLTRGGMAEKRYDVPAALADYRRFLDIPEGRRELTASQLLDLRKKILLLSWVSGSTEALHRAIRDPATCDPEKSGMVELCDRYSILSALTFGGDPIKVPAVKKFLSERRGKRKGRSAAAIDLRAGLPIENQVLWAIHDLAHDKIRGLDEKLRVARFIAAGWGRVDSLAKFTVISPLTESMAITFRSLRSEIRDSSKIKMDPKSIGRRVEKIKKVEAAVGDIIAIPFAKIQAALLNETASLYMDLAAEIGALPQPAGINTDEEVQSFRSTLNKVSAPFEATGASLRGKAYETVSEGGVEGEIFGTLARQYFAERPDLAKHFLPTEILLADSSIGPKAFLDVDDDSLWEGTKNENLRSEWLTAVSEKKWARVSYLLAVAKEKALVPPMALSFMMAMSLTSIGSRAEGLIVLEDVKTDRAMGTLVRVYTSTLGKDKVLQLAKKFEDGIIPGSLLDAREKSIVAYWSEHP